MEGVKHNYAYMPVFVNKDEYGMSRDSLYELLKSHDVMGRKYFYPLISNFPVYKTLPSASKENLPVANRLSEEVLCLPIYAGLSEEDTERIISIIKNKQ